MRRNRRPVALLSGLASATLLALLGGSAAAEERVTDRHEGYPLYQRFCAGCHGADATGNGPQAAELAEPPADLTRLSIERGRPVTMNELTRVIDGRRTVRAHGTGEMPVWGEELAAGVEDPNLRERARIRLIQSLAEYVIAIQQPIPGAASQRSAPPTP